MSSHGGWRQTAHGGDAAQGGRGRTDSAEAPRNSSPLGFVATTGLAIVDVPASPPSSASVSSLAESDPEDAAARALLPQPLPVQHGVPLFVRERIGGAMAMTESRDPRLIQMSMGFPISVHPIRIPNTRGMWSSASSTSVVDVNFVRLAGILHRMLPLRLVDDVQLSGVFGGNMKVYGRVDVSFDAYGFEFNVPCWVTDLGFPVEILLGSDWMVNNGVESTWSGGGPIITGANAKRVRNIQDVYITE
ncbi:hypothetical protein BKA93DRAFT_256186 [Sparassis latifolia]|uniref:Uncharacterized protein n=1 Tax=Sparassis crispa TaxID=139825 RepID=A0A401GMD4_9APHY|nr:hypothetical protein SCP_0504130 [Sparassis crispa]GBE83365.1 hypothetical protein SCP_0504130 [Sparassis crispa]